MERPRIRTKVPGITYRESPQGRRYIVGYTDGNGVKRTKTLPAGATLEDAKTARGQLLHRKAMGDTLMRCTYTVAEALDLYMEQRSSSLRPKSVEVYTWAIDCHLKRAFGNRKLVDLSASDVARLIAELKSDGKKTWTVKKILAPLSGCYQIAVREGWVAQSPLSKLLPHERPKGDQKEMRVLSRDEITRLLDATTNERQRALFSLLLFTGLRIGEALALTWDDILEDRVVVRVSKTKAGEREVMLIPAVKRLLNAWRLKQAPGIPLVFSATGRPCNRKSTMLTLRAAERRAGIPDYTLHELRHTFASIMIAQGELVTLVSRQMGHADPSITLKVYSHLWEAQESVDAARERLQAAMGGAL